MPYKGGKRDKAKLLYREEVYTPEGAKSLSDKELNKEYSRLRSIARKRLERFAGTEWTDTQIFRQNVELSKPIKEIKNDLEFKQLIVEGMVYKPIKEIKSNRELRYLFSDLAHFVKGEVNSVKALEKQRTEGVKTLNERGYDFINKQNYRKFADFMEYARVANLNKLYDSKRIAEFYDWAEKRKLSGKVLFEAFRSWTKNQAKLKKIQNKNPRTSKQYRQDFDN